MTTLQGITDMAGKGRAILRILERLAEADHYTRDVSGSEKRIADDMIPLGLIEKISDRYPSGVHAVVLTDLGFDIAAEHVAPDGLPEPGTWVAVNVGKSFAYGHSRRVTEILNHPFGTVVAGGGADYAGRRINTIDVEVDYTHVTHVRRAFGRRTDKTPFRYIRTVSVPYSKARPVRTNRVAENCQSARDRFRAQYETHRERRSRQRKALRERLS